MVIGASLYTFSVVPVNFVVLLAFAPDGFPTEKVIPLPNDEE
jgi:hypothetical protein